MSIWVDVGKVAIAGLDMESPEYAKRWYSFYLQELFRLENYFIQKYFENCRNWRDVAEKVIKEIKYPLTITKQPTDEHELKAFKKCPISWHVTLKIKDDFWQEAPETALMGYGDRSGGEYFFTN